MNSGIENIFGSSNYGLKSADYEQGDREIVYTSADYEQGDREIVLTVSPSVGQTRFKRGSRAAFVNREATKKGLLLMARPLRPNPPPPRA